jgi:LacI family transcriptional regulator
VILGLEETAAAHGQALYVVGTQGRNHADQLVTDLSSRVDGLVIAGRTVPDQAIRQLEKGHLPVVLLARNRVGAADAVRSENSASAEQLTRHLMLHGHRSIAFIGDPESSPDAMERWQGFLSAQERVQQARMMPVTCAFSETEGHQVALRLLRDRARPSALFCASDEIAMGAYSAAAELGLRIPIDLAVTGWDDIAVARRVTPGLTTVRQPLREMGVAAARLLLERVEQSRIGVSTTVLPTELIIRSSCGCQP